MLNEDSDFHKPKTLINRHKIFESESDDDDSFGINIRPKSIRSSSKATNNIASKTNFKKTLSSSDDDDVSKYSAKNKPNSKIRFCCCFYLDSISKNKMSRF
jgi:hypothetical protein